MTENSTTLQQAVSLGHRDRKVFDWPNAQGALNKLEEEVLELKEAMTQNDTKEVFAEFSDVFLTLLQVARHLKIDPEKNLEFAMDKYKLRYASMASLIEKDQKDISSLELDELESYWQKAKKNTMLELSNILNSYQKT